LSERRVFPGESIELKLRVVNNKFLPLSWVQVEDEIPVSFVSGEPLLPGNRPGSGLLSKAAALLWYTGVSWRQSLCCQKRGYYRLGPVTVNSGDIFGFYPRSMIEPLVEHVIVYPRIYPIAQLGVPSLYPLGETTAERRIFEDTTRTIGVRDYNPQDSLKHIHWKATARHQRLQVKVFEPTTTLKVAIFVVVDSFRAIGVQNEADFELGLSTAASVANYVTGQGSQVGLFVNTRLADSGQSVRILPGSGTHQLVGILEALARVTPDVSERFEEFLGNQLRNITWGTAIAFIVCIPTAAMTGLFLNLKERGHRILVFQIGHWGHGGSKSNIAWHNIGHPEGILKTG
jgi:uncharacterized protein (DUF58 family)